MANLSTLKARIAADLRRNDLTSDIGYAIADAVAEYQGSRFYFNQARDSFTTVAGTEFYESGTDPQDIPDDIAEVDSLTVTVNGRVYQMDKWAFGVSEWINSTSTSRGQPTNWAWYAQKVRLYPVPDNAYTVTISYLQKIAAPTADGDENAWTTEAEILIRSCAKKILYRDVLKNPARAAEAEAAEMNAKRRLKRETFQLDSGYLAASGI